MVRRSSQGYTLIELVVALVVASVVGAFFFETLMETRQASRKAREIAQATLVAEDILATHSLAELTEIAAGNEIAEAERGDMRFLWRIRISDLDLSDEEQNWGTASRVDVELRWPVADPRHSHKCVAVKGR